MGEEGEGEGGGGRLMPPVEVELWGGALVVRVDGRKQWDLIARSLSLPVAHATLSQIRAEYGPGGVRAAGRTVESIAEEVARAYRGRIRRRSESAF
jgi:hypothetical protein